MIELQPNNLNIDQFKNNIIELNKDNIIENFVYFQRN